MESILNKSFIPLQSGRVYIGDYDKVEAYASAVINLLSDQPCLITMFQSQNKTEVYTTTFTSVANTHFVQTVPITSPFVYFSVRNQSSTDQTELAFTVTYRIAFAFTQLPIQRTSSRVWTASTVATGETSTVLDCSNLNSNTISIYGTTSVLGNIAIQMSDDSVGPFFSSQYSANVAVGPFGFSISCSAPYVRALWTGSTTVVSAVISAS